jgi:hypothetical protein
MNVGTKVVALTSPLNNRCQPRIKGQIYTVTGVKYCSSCGRKTININDNKPNQAPTIKCRCGDISGNKNRAWTYAEHFVPLDEIPAKIQELIAVEDYEMCQLLYDVMEREMVGVRED